jgi:hypothetical protein
MFERNAAGMNDTIRTSFQDEKLSAKIIERDGILFFELTDRVAQRTWAATPLLRLEITTSDCGVKSWSISTKSNRLNRGIPVRMSRLRTRRMASPSASGWNWAAVSCP